MPERRSMNTVLLILHFLGLILAFAPAVANGIVARIRQGATPDGAIALGRIPAIVARFGWVGLGLLLVTGPLLVSTKYGGWSAMPWSFWVKMAAVAVVVVAAVWGAALQPRLAKGDKRAAGTLAVIGP